MNPDPLAELAPDWTPYRYGFNNPLRYIDPDGLFESRSDAKDWAKENNIRTGFFRKHKIRNHDDGSWSVDNRNEGYSYHRDSEAYSDLGTSSDGVIKSVYVTNTKQSLGVDGGIVNWGISDGNQIKGHKGSTQGSFSVGDMPFSGPTGPKSHSKIAEFIRLLLDGFGLVDKIPEPSNKNSKLKGIVVEPSENKEFYLRYHHNYKGLRSSSTKYYHSLETLKQVKNDSAKMMEHGYRYLYTNKSRKVDSVTLHKK